MKILKLFQYTILVIQLKKQANKVQALLLQEMSNLCSKQQSVLL